MKQYDNNMRGVLFRNDKQRDGKNDPDYQGNCEVNHVQYWLSAWIKEGKNGKFMSIAIRPKEGRADDGVHRSANVPDKSMNKAADFDDDIPF
jgi:hypothetical protein